MTTARVVTTGETSAKTRTNVASGGLLQATTDGSWGTAGLPGPSPPCYLWETPEHGKANRPAGRAGSDARRAYRRGGRRRPKITPSDLSRQYDVAGRRSHVWR